MYDRRGSRRAGVGVGDVVGEGDVVGLDVLVDCVGEWLADWLADGEDGSCSDEPHPASSATAPRSAADEDVAALRLTRAMAPR